MKTLYTFFAMLMIIAVANGQGTNCSNAINLTPTNNLTYLTHTSNGKELWAKFTAQTSSVNISLKTKPFGNDLEHAHEATIYEGTCGGLSEVKKDELPFVDYAEELSIDMNASGLISGNTYYLKIDREAHLLPCDKTNCTANNSSNPAIFDLAIQNISILVPKDFGLEKPPAAYTYEQNRGQLIDFNNNFIPEIKMYNNKMNPAVYLGEDKASFVWVKADTSDSTPDSLHRVDMALVGSNPKPQIFRTENNPSQTNYFLPHTKRGVHSKESYGRIIAKEVYNKIDMQLSANDKGLKIYYTVQPGGNADDIVMKFDGATVNVTSDSSKLEIITPLGTLDFEAGHAYQINPGDQIVPMPWQAKFISLGGGMVKLDIRQYPQNMPLFIQIDRGHTTTAASSIDNMLWSTFWGGSNNDNFFDIKTDLAGNIYIAGQTGSTNFPTAIGSSIQPFGGYIDAVTIKLNSSIVPQWTNFLGGTGREIAESIALDTNGNVFISGRTWSNNFPLIATGGAYLDSNNTSGTDDGFIAKYNNTGSILQWSSYYGVDSLYDNLENIAIDDNDNVYAIGQGYPNSDLLVLPGAYNSAQGNGIIVKFDNNGIRKWATLFPAGPTDIAIDNSNDVYLTGAVSDPSFPVLDAGGGIISTPQGGSDAFITKFNGATNNISWSTIYGGSEGEVGYGIAIDNNANAVYVVGNTRTSDTASVPFPLVDSDPFSNTDFLEPQWRSVYLTNGLPSYDVFLLKLNKTTNKVLWSTYFGGDGDDLGLDVTVDDYGYVYIVGSTRSDVSNPPLSWQSKIHFPATSPFNYYIQDSLSEDPNASSDGFLSLFTPDLALGWTTYYGRAGNPNCIDALRGVTVHGFNLYVAGYTYASSLGGNALPTTQFSTTDSLDYYQEMPGNFTSTEGLAALFDVTKKPEIITSANKNLIENDYEFILYPNPTTGNLLLKINSSQIQEINISIINILGEQVFNKKIKNIPPMFLNITELAKGMYFIKVETDEKAITRKFIKQ